jgi:cytochrome c-type biogenesis protein CcmH/NrfG
MATSGQPAQAAIIDLPDILQSLHNKAWTGVLEVTSKPSEKRLSVFFESGLIQHAHPSSQRAMIGLILYKLGSLDLSDLNFALTAQEREARPFAQLCLDYALVDAEELDTALLFRGREELLAMLAETEMHDAALHAGEAPPGEVFDTEDLQVTLRLNPVGLLMEAARREDEWALTRAQIGSDDEVFVRAEEHRPIAVEHRPLALLCDGYRTAEEVARYSPLPMFEAFSILRELRQDGVLRTVSPLELAQAAVSAEQQNDADKALRLFELAESRGLDRIEISKRIAIAQQQLGRPRLALKRWFMFAERCLEQNNIGHAIEAYRAASRCVPTDLEATQQLARLLARTNQEEQARSCYEELIEALAEEHPKSSALTAALRDLLELDPDNDAARERLADLHLAADEAPRALQLFDELSRRQRDRGELPAAILSCRRLLAIEPSNLSGRRSLAELFALTGELDEAVEQYQTLAETITAHADFDLEVSRPLLTRAHEAVIRLSPQSITSLRWLAEGYDQQGQIDQAVSRYMGLVQALRAEGGDERPIIEPLERVIALAPERIDVRRMLGHCHVKFGHSDQAAQVYLSLASYAMQREQHELAREAYHTVLELQPLKLEAQAGHAMLDEVAKRPQSAARRWRLLGGIALRAGLYSEADGALTRARELDCKKPQDLKDLADAREGLMRYEEATALLALYAGLMIEQQNLGLAREALEHGRVLCPDHQSLTPISAALDRIKGKGS